MAGAKEMPIVRLPAAPSAELAAMSRGALDRPLAHAAELVIAAPLDAAVILGSMQRFGELEGAGLPADARVMRRGSGGAEVSVGPGTLWMQLSLANASALVACEPGRLLNRYVRPLLRAISKVGALAHYFDRDWVSASRGSVKAPIAQVAFAHDTTTGRALVEAFVAVATPFAVRPRGTFLGQTPLTLRALGVDPGVDVERLGDAVALAYAKAYGVVELHAAAQTPRALDFVAPAADVRDDPPWAATREEAIGIVAAGRARDGRVRVGGELMASRDVIARLEEEIAEASRDGIDGARIDRALDALTAPGAAMLGVRSLRSLREAIDDALASS
jgi:hypothetical protein